MTLRNVCLRCGGKAEFTVLLPDPKTRGGKEKDGPCPLVWHCLDCRYQRPLTLG